MENNLDKLFKSKLEGQEPKFHPAAWDRMESLLEEEGMVPPPKKKSRRAGIIIFFIFIIGIFVSGIGWNAISTNSTIVEGSAVSDSELKTETSNQISQEESNTGSKEIKEASNNYIQSGTTQKPTLNPDSQITSSPEKGDNDILDNANQHLEIDNNLFQESTKTIENKGKQNLGNFAKVISKPVNNDNQIIILEGALENRGNDGVAKNENPNSINVILNSAASSELDSGLNSDLISNQISSNEVIPNQFQIRDMHILPIGISSLESPISSFLLAPNSKPIIIQKNNDPTFAEIGTRMNTRYNNGLGYSIGPYVSCQVGNGYFISLSGQLDVQNFSNSPEITVDDKEYSFGSTITERTFSLNNQKSITIPISINKSFNGFSFNAGLSLHKTLLTTGSIQTSLDGSKDELNIVNELVKPLRISMFSGASLRISRHIIFDVALEYRPGIFTEDPATNYSKVTIYPSIGLSYSLFKL